MTAPITFLSDFGAGSDYVGICHAVMARIAPAARVIDLGHNVPAGDIRAGAHLLARAIPYAEPGVHLAVVDPGVGTGRRALAVGTRGERVFVGPDNGLLSAAVVVAGGAAWAREISESDYRVKPVSLTFWGRDVFAPVAAALAAGARPEEVGAEIDTAGLEPGPPHSVELIEGVLRAPVVYRDGFGNLALEASWSEIVTAGLAEPGMLRENAVNVGAGRTRAVASCGEAAYAAVGEGAMLLHPDSFGAAEISVNAGSAASELDASVGDIVSLSKRR
jgi:hypothetical protein